MNSSTQSVRTDIRSAKTFGGTLATLGTNEQSGSGSVLTPDGELDLEDIDFVETAQEARSVDPDHRHDLIQDKMESWRQIFLSGVMHQIALARDSEYRYPRQRFVNCDGITGKTVEYVAPDPWWFEKDGELHLRLNFGERNWCLKGKNPVIRVGTVKDLLPLLEKLHLLNGAGEFDDIIEKMVIVSDR